ncbi:MAG: HAMP domain-containing histidine kinase [Spirochaetales bacterium]|nr:HAMP domain-containing histidine kinase [Spirochaetales bacterium]
MFLKSLKFKIAALFSVIFIVTSALLFLAFYLFQYNVLVREDTRSLEARTIEFWAIYQTGGAVAIQRALNIETFLTDYDPFLLRIASSTNKTLAFYHPTSWKSYDIGRLETTDPFSAEETLKIPSLDGKSRLDVISLTLPDGNILQIGASSAERQLLLSRFRSIYVIALVPIVALGFLAGLLFSSRMVKPVNSLISVTRGIIETGSMDQRLKVSGRGDELDELTDLFNQMLERIERLIERMRISLDNVAHDLRTPMTRLRQKLEAASAADGDRNGDANPELGGALEEAEHIRKMLNALMDISEAESGVMKLSRVTVDLSGLVTDLVEFYSYLAEEKGVTLHCDAARPVHATVDVDRFRQVVTNLLDNAVKYTRVGDRIDVAVYNTPAPAGARTGARESSENGGGRLFTTLTVADTGIGIPPEDMPHIWERLFRGDKSRSAPGLGLGLGLVKAIVEAHGGTVEAESRAGKGSKFTVTLY